MEPHRGETVPPAAGLSHHAGNTYASEVLAVLILSNDDVEKMVTMDECLSVLEELYRDLAQGAALFMPRIDNIMDCSHDDAYYAFKHMGGGWPRHRIMAMRVNSDVISHPAVGGMLRRVKLPMAGGKWVGLIQLYSSETGQLLALFPDGVAQRLRVGATNGLGIRYLARKDARRAALIGSGWQAETQLLALLETREIEEVAVFSPTRENRDSFIESMHRKCRISIVAADSPEQCVKDADIIMTATSSVVPVHRRDWLREGIHLSCIKANEIDRTVLNGCSLVCVHTNIQEKQRDNVLPGTRHIPEEHAKGWWNDGTQDSFSDLADLVSGRAKGRSDDGQITCFINNVGIGLQFAALGALILQKARRLGYGRNLPDEWFCETVHP